MASLSGNATQTSAELAMSQRDCEFVAKIQEVIADQLADENFSIDTLAEQMTMSRSNFYLKKKGVLDLTPNEYLRIEVLMRSPKLVMDVYIRAI